MNARISSAIKFRASSPRYQNAEPTPIAVAPAISISTASRPVNTPPVPMIGTATALGNLRHTPQSNWLERRAGNTTCLIVEHWLGSLRVNHHPRHGIDGRDRVSPGIHHRSRNSADIRHVWRQLDGNRNGANGTLDRACHRRSRCGVSCKRGPEIIPHIRAGDIDLDQNRFGTGDNFTLATRANSSSVPAKILAKERYT